VLDRASTFSDPEIVRLLKTEFVPVAIDQAYQRRQQDAEGRFYQKIVNQGPRKAGEGTTQGRYLATADGVLLGYNNNRDTARLLELMREALQTAQPAAVEAIEAGSPDTKYVYGPPQGGLVVRVDSRVLGGYEETTDEWRKMFQEGMGRDNLWIRKDEHESLVRGEVPESLITRLARFHLVDNTRGEPPMWETGEIIEKTIELKDGKLSGSLHLRTASSEREFKADLLGYLQVTEGRVTRFDLVAKGLFRGDGPYTRGAPEGEFPLAIAFRLADGSDLADGIPPQGSRGWLDGYLK
jgi:hypothetical protein